MIALIIFYCSNYYGGVYRINPELIRSIAYVESTFNPQAASKGEKDVGLMQVRHMYVGESKEDLLEDPCLNIEVGTRILANAKKLCKHKENHGYLVCYNRGVYGGSLVEDYKADGYYNKVMGNFKKGETNRYILRKVRESSH